MKFIRKSFPLVLAMLFITTTAFSQEKASETELTNFAKAYTEIQGVNEKAQEEMATVIQESGMEIATFNMIYQASQTQVMPEGVSQEDAKKFEEVVTEIEKMHPKFQKQMEEAITENDLSVERYQQMMALLQTDEEMQQKLQSKLQ